MTGWICLHRKITEWEWYTDANTMRLFVHFLLKANHTDKKWRGVEIKRGSFITSYDHLSTELNLSVKQIRTALDKLKRTSEVASKTTSKYSIITVLNYDLYQDKGKQEGSQRASKGQAKGKQRATTNNDNNNNNENNETKEHKTPCSLPAHDCLDDSQSLEIKQAEYYDKPPFSPDDISTKALEHRFDEFWAKYPVKKSKADAKKKWMKIKPDQKLLDTIIKALSDQTEEKDAQRKHEGFAPYWKNPSTWLNQKCWEDEIYIPEQLRQRKSALDNYYDDKPKKIHPSMEGLGDEIGRRPGETPTQYWHRLERAKAKLRESRSDGYSVPMGPNDKNTGPVLDRPNGFN